MSLEAQLVDLADPAGLERTVREYEAIPYLSKPIVWSHPAHLAGIARLLGLDPPPVETARILELGGASGGNLIPVAAHHPGARCMAVDISPGQVEAGRTRAKALGLANIAFECASISDLDASLGEWDYVIAHGVYSWVPAPVREALVRLAGTVLAPRGIFYLSYNVLPGWRMSQPARDAIRALVPPHLPERERLRAARSVLDLAVRRGINPGAYGGQLRTTCAHLLERSDDFLFHDFMEPENEPFLFGDVMTQADRHGLAFLAEADFCTGFDANFGADFAADIRARTGGDALPWEALFDVLSGRNFRQTLMARSDAAHRIDRAIDPARLEGLHLLVARGAHLEAERGSLRASSPHGLSFTLAGQEFAALGRQLLAAAPGSLDFADVRRGCSAGTREALSRAVVRLLTAGILEARAAPMVTAGASERPVATRLARGDAAAGHSRTANIRHESIVLEPEMVVLLPALDGTADHAALARRLAEATLSGAIRWPEGVPPQDADALALNYAEQVPIWLDGLAELGLLEA